MANKTKMEDQNVTLFDDEEQVTQAEKTIKAISPKACANLDVVKMQFLVVEQMPWEELFDGFDTIKAITYSSGLDFMFHLISKFSDAEIIFGCEDVLANGLDTIMAFQTILMEKIGKNKSGSKAKLIDRVQDKSLRLFVTRNVVSHEKIYLLAARDGRRRVIMGSANMSDAAFSGIQRENIGYFDDKAAYDWYHSVYESLKTDSSDSIDEASILNSENDITSLPISKTVYREKVVTIVPPSDAEKNNVRFVLDVKNLAKKLLPSIPKAENKTGKILLTTDKISIMRKQVQADAQREKELREEHPQLEVDIQNKTAILNDKELALYPSKEEVARDVDLFLQYIDGYNRFHGDTEELKNKYYAFTNWFFCSPFMAQFRDMAERYNRNTLAYPVFGLLYGQSKAGKTSFLETLLKMMIGQKVKVAASEFTRTSINGLKRTVKGAPIIVDDLTSARFNQHAVETIKDDSFGVAEQLANYPAVVISANEDVKAVAQEIIRRTVICHVSAGLTNTEVMKSSVVRLVQRDIGTAFYREYLRRMLEQSGKLLEQLKDNTVESSPDILALSSNVLFDIISEYTSKDIPSCVRKLTIDDYFAEKITGAQTIKLIQKAWETNKKAFVVSSKRNELSYNAGAVWEAERIIKELPETLEPRKSREMVIMKLDAAKEFFGIRFRRSLFGH